MFVAGPAVYFEEGARQSQATPNGEKSVFTYVKIMDELLSRSEHILVLGCGAEILRQGCRVSEKYSRLLTST